jgi:predicted RNase H-like HicB family nuclease
MKVSNFTVILEQEKDGGFSVSVPSLPGCFSQGDTFEEAISNIREAISLYLEDAKMPQTAIASFSVPVQVRH